MMGSVKAEERGWARDVDHDPNAQVFEESKRSLAFVAERVLCSLANALHRFRNLPAPGQPLPAEVGSGLGGRG